MRRSRAPAPLPRHRRWGGRAAGSMGEAAAVTLPLRRDEKAARSGLGRRRTEALAIDRRAQQIASAEGAAEDIGAAESGGGGDLLDRPAAGRQQVAGRLEPDVLD